jgi:hypothetical protein
MKMDPFAALPWFALTEILSNLPDLFTLHSLYTASPSVATFLAERNAQFAQIIDAIIARPSRDRGLLPYIQDLVRLVILLWNRNSQGTDAAHSYAEILVSMKHVGKRFPWEQSPVSKTIPLSTPSTALFKFIDLMSRLRWVAHECFHSMIDKSLKLPVEHLSQRDFTAQGRGMRPGKYRRGNDPVTDPSKRPQGIPYAPVDIGPLTRLEEQQLIASLLCVVIFYDLRATYPEFSTVPEISKHADSLLSENVDGFWEEFESGITSRPEQLRSILLCLDEQAGGRENIQSWLRSAAPSTEKSNCCRHYTLVTNDQEPWDETKHHIMHGITRGYESLRRSKIGIHCPIRYLDLAIFRPYGLVFWETQRLDALGYVVVGNPMPLWFALSSIFTEQDWERIIEEQRARPY